MDIDTYNASANHIDFNYDIEGQPKSNSNQRVIPEKESKRSITNS